MIDQFESELKVIPTFVLNKTKSYENLDMKLIAMAALLVMIVEIWMN